MSDTTLDPFQADVRTLPGVGTKARDLLKRLTGGVSVLDLIFHLPTSWIDRSNRTTIAEANLDEVSTLRATVDQVALPYGRAPARIRVRDETGFLSVIYFRANRSWLERTFKKDAEVILSGVITERSGGRQMSHPDHVSAPESGDPPPPIEPVYPLTAGLTQRQIQKFMNAALLTVPEVEEWIDQHLLDKKDWPSFIAAFKLLHQPTTYDLSASTLARERLAYDEALAREIALGQARLARERQKAPNITTSASIERTIVDALPFQLTEAQRRAYADLSADMQQGSPMRRLLQGDVGSGKTIVAALAAAQVAAAGKLTALMSPTEVLARQQAASFDRFLSPAGFRCAPLTSRDKGKERAAILRDIRAGRIAAVSGTQSLYQSDVDLPNLALIIIDEQHRFGVADRMKLASKGVAPHLLVMSATPIPRTMALAFHGDMEISTIRQKPVGRKEIKTAALADTRIKEVVRAIQSATRRGERAFWICPAVDSEDLGDAAAETRFELLSRAVSGSVELVHGRMSPEHRDAALERFRSGEARVLVATTVIEVGVDVPDATIIVIERADKFGLAQLHQLRGRVGRGDKESSCVLLYKQPLTDSARERLDILRKTNDGFAIAEADFKFRGAGDVLGAQQSGAPDMRVLDIVAHANLMETARSDAKSILMGDPNLKTKRGAAARMVRDLLAPRLASLLRPSRSDQSPDG